MDITTSSTKTARAEVTVKNDAGDCVKFRLERTAYSGQGGPGDAAVLRIYPSEPARAYGVDVGNAASLHALADLFRQVAEANLELPA